MPATVVLVHGAFHGAWCWRKVVPLLDAAGVPAVAVDLPGHGEHRGALGDLYAHADWLRNTLQTVDGPIVLVGHSYGGAVITEAAAGVPGVARLVYLCAVVPDVGETLPTILPDALTPEERVSKMHTAMRTDDAGHLVVDPDGAVDALYGDCAADDVAYALAHLGPQEPGTFTQPIRVAAWREIPSTYVLCTEDRAVNPSFQHAMAARTTDVVELRASHSPFFSQPEALADLLIRESTGVDPDPRIQVR